MVRRKKSYRRTPAQEDYFKRHPKCRVCGRPADHVHHISHNRQDDSDDNLESLCFDHHTGERGVHTLGDVKFCEWFQLTKDPKWEGRYQRLKSKMDFNYKMGGRDG